MQGWLSGNPPRTKSCKQKGSPEIPELFGCMHAECVSKISAICSSGYLCHPPKTSAGPSCGSGNFRNVKTDSETILIFPEMQGRRFRKPPEIQQGKAARSYILAPGSLQRHGKAASRFPKLRKSDNFHASGNFRKEHPATVRLIFQAVRQDSFSGKQRRVVQHRRLEALAFPEICGVRKRESFTPAK